MGILKSLKRLLTRKGDDMRGVRTSIPHGMSQENRVHPLFIILRKHSEEEERLFRRLVRYTIWTTVLSILMITIPMIYFARTCALVVIITGGVAITTVAFLVEQYKVILGCINRNWLIFPKVNKMLHSDDYSAAVLNYENVVNLIGEVRSMKSYLKCKIVDSVRNVGYSAIIIGFGVLAHFISGGVF